MCASIMPLISPHGVGDVDGSPVMLISDSGKTAQPSALSKPKAPASPGATSFSAPEPSAASALPAAGSETLNVPPPWESTFQSACGLASSALVVASPEPARNFASLV